MGRSLCGFRLFSWKDNPPRKDAPPVPKQPTPSPGAGSEPELTEAKPRALEVVK